MIFKSQSWSGETLESPFFCIYTIKSSVNKQACLIQFLIHQSPFPIKLYSIPSWPAVIDSTAKSWNLANGFIRSRCWLPVSPLEKSERSQSSRWPLAESSALLCVLGLNSKTPWCVLLTGETFLSISCGFLRFQISRLTWSDPSPYRLRE